MTDLVKTIHTGESGHLVNGIPANTMVFCFNGATSGVHVYVHDILTGKIAGNKEDLQNIEFIKREFGLASDENYFQNTLDYTKGKSADGKTGNEYLGKKFIEVRNANYKICRFVLETLHDLNWLVFEGIDQKTSRLSGIRMKDALNLIKEPIEDLMAIYNRLIEMKYPSKLATSTLAHEVKMDKLQLGHEMDPLRSEENKIRKKKKSIR